MRTVILLLPRFVEAYSLILVLTFPNLWQTVETNYRQQEHILFNGTENSAMQVRLDLGAQILYQGDHHSVHWLCFQCKFVSSSGRVSFLEGGRESYRDTGMEVLESGACSRRR
jgi:hypothetical protein